MHYVNFLGDFNTYHNTYILLKKQTFPEVPVVSDKEKEKKIIKWVPIFEYALLRTFGNKGPLVYIVLDNADILYVGDFPLTENAHYGASVSALE